MSRKKEITESVDRLKAINVAVSSEGGQILVKSFQKEVLNSMYKLAYNYGAYSHPELVSECANLRARLELLRTFTAAKKNQEIAENDLAELLKEESEL